MKPPFRNFPLTIRFILMFLLFVFNLGVLSFVGILLIKPLFGVEDAMKVASGVFNSRADINAFLFVQALSSIGGFILTPMMFSVLETGEFKRHLRLHIPASLRFLLLGLVSILVVQFFIEFLVKVNGKIPLPESLAFLRDKEEQMTSLIKALLNFNSVGEFIAVAFVVAVIPAVGEEMFFRGLILGDLLKARVNVAASIIISGLLFAVVHMEYENTLAIWALGGFLGYLYYVSGSLWLPIAVHFVNNFLQVLLKYLHNTGVMQTDLTETSAPLYVTAISVVLFGGCLYLFHQWRNPPDFALSEEFKSAEEESAA